MESAYSRTGRERRGKVRSRRTAGGYHPKRKVALAPRERRRLTQLGVCLALFLVIFLGRGVFPERMDTLRGELLQLIQTDTDFKAAFANLGRSIQRGEPVLDTLGDLWVDVFAGGGRVSSTYVNPRDHAPLYHEELAFLNARPTAVELLERRFGGLPAGAMSRRETVAEDVTVLPSAPEPVAYDGPPLPENATMERLPLGLDQTAAPVMAVVSSG